MLSLHKLSTKAAAIANGSLSVDDFEDWFFEVSAGLFQHSGEFWSDRIADVEYGLVAYDSGEMDASKLADELSKIASLQSEETVPMNAKKSASTVRMRDERYGHRSMSSALSIQSLQMVGSLG